LKWIFEVETEKITTNTIEKFIDFLLSMISPVGINKCLLQILLSKMHQPFTGFNEKFNMSFSQMVCMLWMTLRIKDTLSFQRELQNISLSPSLPTSTPVLSSLSSLFSMRVSPSRDFQTLLTLMSRSS
jgi:hypothetical protein